MSEVAEDNIPTITISEELFEDGSVDKKSYDLGDGRTYVEDFDENGNIIAKNWYLNGNLHREGAPASLDYSPNGVLEAEHFRIHGKYPKISKTDPFAIYYREDGRLLGEAFLISKDKDCYHRYYNEDQTLVKELWLNSDHEEHREDGPAIKKFDQDGNLLFEVWCKYGERHNDFDVAYREYRIESDNVIEAYFLNGEQLTPDEWYKSKRDKKTGLRYVRTYSKTVNEFLSLISLLMMLPYFFVTISLGKILGIDSSSVGGFLYLMAYAVFGFQMKTYVNHVIALAKNDKVEMRNTKDFFWNFAACFVFGLICYVLSSFLAYVFGTTPYISAVLGWLKANFFGFTYGLSVWGATLSIPILAAKMFAKHRH